MSPLQSCKIIGPQMLFFIKNIPTIPLRPCKIIGFQMQMIYRDAVGKPLRPCKIIDLQMVNYYFPSCSDTPFSHALQKVQVYIWVFNYFLPPYV